MSMGWVLNEWVIETSIDPIGGKVRRIRYPAMHNLVDPGNPRGQPYSWSAIGDSLGKLWVPHDQAWLQANSFVVCLAHGMDWSAIPATAKQCEDLFGPALDGQRIRQLDTNLNTELPNVVDREWLKAQMDGKGVALKDMPRDDEPVGYHLTALINRYRPDLGPSDVRRVTVKGM